MRVSYFNLVLFDVSIVAWCFDFFQLFLSATAYFLESSKNNVLFIDTCGSFDCARLEEMLIERGHEEKVILSISYQCYYAAASLVARDVMLLGYRWPVASRMWPATSGVAKGGSCPLPLEKVLPPLLRIAKKSNKSSAFLRYIKNHLSRYLSSSFIQKTFFTAKARHN